MELNRIIYFGKVLDNDDIDRLGRLRVAPLDENQKVIEVSIPDKCAVKSNGTTVGIKDSCKWTKDDPFLVRPLLPFALNVTPKTDELVMLVYPIAQNSHSTFKRYTDNFKYYVPMSPTTPNRAGFENYNVTKSNTPLGDNIKQSKSYKEVGGVIPKSIFGLFPEPNDNAILGRGSTDIILKEDDLLLRAGKTLNLVPSDSGQPSVYDKRAFLQMSVFKSRTVIERVQQTEKRTIQYPNLAYLIEWNIVNPENEQNAFRTNVRVYEIKSNDEKINTKNFKVDTDIKTIIDSSKIVKQLDTGPDSFDNTITQINNFLNEWNNAKFEYGGKSAFPFAFRPARSLFLKWTDTNNLNSAGSELIEGINISKFYNNIKLNPGAKDFGFGILYSKDTPNPPIKKTKSSIRPENISSKPVTYGVLGSDKIYLLSHESATQKGSIDLRDTIYGIKEDKLARIQQLTEPMVRGEALMDLLNLIVKFMIAHVHPYHGLPPVPTAQDGTLASDILQKILNSNQTILNQNIRIN
jgi:hypothetical protein